jgi:hypothetical protein
VRRVVLCSLLFGCGAARPSAETTTDALLDALARGDATTLSALTGRSPEETEALLADARTELAGVATAARERAPEVRARAYLESGGVVAMVEEDGGWRVASGILGVPSLETPADAIRALHGMLGRVSGTGFEAVLARSSRLAFHEEIERWWRGTADPDALGIAIDGDSAIVTTPSGGTIELRREAGEWRIVDLR